MKTRHLTTSSTLFAGVLATALCVAPPPIEAEIFGYAGVKGGYSYQRVDRIELENRGGSAVPAPPPPAGGDKDGFFFKPSFHSAISVGANVGLGYNFTPRFGLRFEAEYIYRVGIQQKTTAWSLRKMDVGGANDSVKVDVPFDPNAKVSIHSQSILGNLYFDYYVIPSVSLYLSAGVGMSFFNAMLDVQTRAVMPNASMQDSSKTSSTSFAWQAGGGVAYALTESLWLDLNIRYIDLGKFKSRINISPSPQNAETTSKTIAFETLLGVSYRF